MVQVSAKLDYAVRALVELAVAAPDRLTRDQIAEAQSVPPKYLESILTSLRQAGFVHSQRGPDGGFVLALDPSTVSVAAIARTVDGPLTLVQGHRPEDVHYEGLEPLTALWVAVRASLRSVLETVTLADLVAGELPDSVASLVDDDEAWLPR